MNNDRQTYHFSLSSEELEVLKRVRDTHGHRSLNHALQWALRSIGDGKQVNLVYK